MKTNNLNQAIQNYLDKFKDSNIKNENKLKNTCK